MKNFNLYGKNYVEVVGNSKHDVIVYTKMNGDIRFYFHAMIQNAYIADNGEFIILFKVFDSGKPEFKALHANNIQYFKEETEEK